MVEKGLNERIRSTRIRRQLSQAKLAERLGVSQSAISHLEKGKYGLVSDEVRSQVLEFLQLELKPGDVPQTETGEVLAYCGNYDCPAALVTVINEMVSAKPLMLWIPAGLGPHFCPECGHPLQEGCLKCHRAVFQRASFCIGCAEPLVIIPDDLKEADPVEVVEVKAAQRDRWEAKRQPRIARISPVPGGENGPD